MITREQATHIAQIARTIRPTWDELALINLIGDHQVETLPQIFEAAIMAATNPRAETPRALNWSEHWRSLRVAGEPLARRTCPVDGHSGVAHNCPQCRSEEIAPRHPQPCPKPGHKYWSHNCLDCRREAKNVVQG